MRLLLLRARRLLSRVIATRAWRHEASANLSRERRGAPAVRPSIDIHFVREHYLKHDL